MTDSLSRRRFLSVAATATVAGSVGLSAWPSSALAAGPAAGALSPLTSADPRVAALGYVADAAKAKADSMFKAGSNCANCSQIKGKAGDKLRPCALFPDLKNPTQMLLVDSAGWCRSWTPIPK